MHGAHLLLDVYHQLNVVPLSLAAEDLLDAFIVGGGYKYCQLGEGNCFLRLPDGCDLRPVVTGWYSEFGALESADPSHRVAYATGGDRFAGATYDPTSHYRGAAVFRFFADKRLDAPLLRDVSQHQIGVLADTFDALGVDPAVIDRDRSAPLSEIAGFLALELSGRRDVRTAAQGAGRLRRCARRRAALRSRTVSFRSTAARRDGIVGRGGALGTPSSHALRPSSVHDELEQIAIGIARVHAGPFRATSGASADALDGTFFDGSAGVRQRSSSAGNVPDHTKQKSPHPGCAVGPRSVNAAFCHSAGACTLILLSPNWIEKNSCFVARHSSGDGASKPSAR